MKTYGRKKKQRESSPYRSRLGRQQEVWQQQEKMPWERSEALYHIYGTGSKKSGSGHFMTGLHELKEAYPALGRMRETFKAGNSYGNIAMGANQKKEAVFVISQKREHNGPVVKEAQKNVHMGRKKREVLPNGTVYMNPDLKQQGALAFQARLSMPAGKALEQMKRYGAQKGSRMLEKRMPYLGLEKERVRLKKLEECRRESYEKGEKLQARQYGRQIQRMRSKISQQEQGEKQMMKNLRDAWQKAKKIPSRDFMTQMQAEETKQVQIEDGQAEEEGVQDKSKIKSEK